MFVPELNGADVLVLHYINGRTEDYKLDQQFWKYQYNTEPDNSLNKLLKMKLIELKLDYYSSLKSLTIEDLKNILESLGKSKSGKKAILIERIIDTPNFENNVSIHVPRIWKATPKGQALINNTDFVLYTHRNLLSYTNPIEIYDYYMHNKTISSKEILVNQMLRITEFAEKSTAIDSGLSMHYLAISQIYKEYGDIHNQIKYLAKSCVKSFVNAHEFDYEIIDDGESVFKTRHDLLPTLVKDVSIVTATDIKLRDLFTEELAKEVSEDKNLKYFTLKEVIFIVLGTIDKNADIVMETYHDVYVREFKSKKTKSRSVPTAKISLVDTITPLLERAERAADRMEKAQRAYHSDRNGIIGKIKSLFNKK